MNIEQLTKHFTLFRKWSETNAAQATTDVHEREQCIARMRTFTAQRLKHLSEEEFFDYIAPLWAMTMWGNKHYQVNNVIEANGMPLLREQFANLVYGQATLDKRWDEFRAKIKGIGPAIMSELLCKTHPDEYLIWNRKTYNGFDILGITGLPRYEARLNGKTYVHLSEQGRQIVAYAKANGYTEVSDMLSLNAFIWQELQVPAEPVKPEQKSEETLIPKNSKEATFIHNDIRDKIADIGRFLGFSADVEKKIATGAIVDAVWEVTIGNMGRVIYVFEVQTCGSIDSLILNLMKAKNNKAVQGIIAVSDQKQIEKIKKEIAILPIHSEVKFWDYEEVLRIHEALQFANESINNLGLIPPGF